MVDPRPRTLAQEAEEKVYHAYEAARRLRVKHIVDHADFDVVLNGLNAARRFIFSSYALPEQSEQDWAGWPSDALVSRDAAIPQQETEDATELVRLIQGKADPSDIALERARLSGSRLDWDEKAKWFRAGRRSAFDGMVAYFNECIPGRYSHVGMEPSVAARSREGQPPKDGDE